MKLPLTGLLRRLNCFRSQEPKADSTKAPAQVSGPSDDGPKTPRSWSTREPSEQEAPGMNSDRAGYRESAVMQSPCREQTVVQIVANNQGRGPPQVAEIEPGQKWEFAELHEFLRLTCEGPRWHGHTLHRIEEAQV